MIELHCAVLVLGGGPAGYTMAIRAGELGLDTVLVEAGELGGTCLNVGCIPSKALLHVADAFAESTARAQGHTPFGLTADAPVLDFAQTTRWIASVVGQLDAGVERLLAQAHVRHIRGWGRCVDGKRVMVEAGDAAIGTEGPFTITTEHLVLATGSRPVELPGLPFGGRVVSSDAVFTLDQVPERLVVVGGGYIGIEIGTAFAKLGAAVTVVESSTRILPGFDDELVRPLSRALARSGVEVLTETSVCGLSSDGIRVVAQRADGSNLELPTDLVLVTVGRAPRPRDGAWMSSTSSDQARSCGSTQRVAHQWPASTRSATSAGSRCSRTAPWRKVSSSRRSSRGGAAGGTASACPRSSSPTRRS